MAARILFSSVLAPPWAILASSKYPRLTSCCVCLNQYLEGCVLVKLTLIVMNIVAAALIIWAGAEIRSFHQADSLSACMDLDGRHLLATSQKTGTPGDSAA